MGEKQNIKYKDTVFRNLFGSDEKSEDKFIQLYNALHDNDLSEKHTLKTLDIEQVLYMNFANDIARLVDNKIIILAEHQSTINNNMPLRCLQYIGRIYEQLQNVKDKYHRRLLKIPTPEFYVFYNGIEDYPVNKELKLSDAFIIKEKSIQLELWVNVININTEKGNELLKKCPILSEYSLFVDSVRKHLEKDPKNGYTKAIKECLQNNILKEYLNRKAKEVNNMLVAEYDYKTDMEVQKEEQREEQRKLLKKEFEKEFEKKISDAHAETEKIKSELFKAKAKLAESNTGIIAKNMKQSGYKAEEISRLTGLSIQELDAL